MKRMIALILALMTVACLFAACGNEPATVETTTEPEVTTTEPETTLAGPTEIVIKKVSKHEAGWMPAGNGTDPGAQGVYFNAFTNDSPFNEDWTLRYMPTETAKVIVVRDGEEYDVTNPGADALVKFSKTEYYLVLDQWLVGDEVFPLVAGDMIILEGGFMDPTEEWVLTFETQYITLKEEGVKTSVDDPRAE